MNQSKIALMGVVSNPPQRIQNHGTGWTLVHKALLQSKGAQLDIIDDKCTSLDEYDIVVLNEGMNYRENKFNVLGGIQPTHIQKLKMLEQYKGRIVTFGDPINYSVLCKQAKLDFDVDIKVENLDMLKLSNKLVLGDSHSLSVFRTGYVISRNDGKTLHGFLNTGLQSFIPGHIRELVFYAGNIDIRHHLCRFENPRQHVKELISNLDLQLQSLDLDKITLVELLPVENEDRVLPKTGYYKGTPFYGTQSQRQELVDYFNSLLNQLCIDRGYSLIKWDFDLEKYKVFTYMESTRSVHLSPVNYKYYEELQ